MSAGKGDSPRKVDGDKYRANYDRIFRKAPVRLCCGNRHLGVICPDGKVMCCLCFNRVDQDQLNTNPEGSKEDVCISCAEIEKEMNYPRNLGRRIK
jgi:hypothetical protein